MLHKSLGLRDLLVTTQVQPLGVHRENIFRIYSFVLIEYLEKKIENFTFDGGYETVA